MESYQSQQLAPNCVLSPQDKKKYVAAAIFILSRIVVVTKVLGIGHCLEGGDHSPFPGGANFDRNITISLKIGIGITVNSDQSKVSVRLEKEWIDVYLRVELSTLTQYHVDIWSGVLLALL